MFTSMKAMIVAWIVVLGAVTAVVVWTNGEYDTKLAREKRNAELAKATEEQRLAELTNKVETIVEEINEDENGDTQVTDIKEPCDGGVAPETDDGMPTTDGQTTDDSKPNDVGIVADQAAQEATVDTSANETAQPTEIPKVDVEAPSVTPQKTDPVAEKTEIKIDQSFDVPKDRWREFAKPFTRNPDLKPIAILMVDMGLRSTESSEAIRTLPDTISYGFHPNGRDSQSAAQNARMNGNEIYMMLPMQPMGSLDPGKYGMLVDAPDGQNISRVQEVSERAEGFVGYVSHMGSRFTTDQDGMIEVLSEIRSKGLAFIDSMSTAKTLTTDVSEALDLSALKSNLFVDNTRNIPVMIDHLTSLEQRADKGRPAIGISRVSDASIQVLQIWTVDLEARGYQLVPVSYFLE